jgi:hypothetical protein
MKKATEGCLIFQVTGGVVVFNMPPLITLRDVLCDIVYRQSENKQNQTHGV